MTAVAAGTAKIKAKVVLPKTKYAKAVTKTLTAGTITVTAAASPAGTAAADQTKVDVRAEGTAAVTSVTTEAANASVTVTADGNSTVSSVKVSGDASATVSGTSKNETTLDVTGASANANVKISTDSVKVETKDGVKTDDIIDNKSGKELSTTVEKTDGTTAVTTLRIDSSGYYSGSSYYSGGGSSTTTPVINVTSVTLDKTGLEVGNTLTVALMPENATNKENYTQYTWYRRAGESEDWVLIEGQSGTSYTLTKDDKGCFIKATASGEGVTEYTATTAEKVTVPLASGLTLTASATDAEVGKTKLTITGADLTANTYYRVIDEEPKGRYAGDLIDSSQLTAVWTQYTATADVQVQAGDYIEAVSGEVSDEGLVIAKWGTAGPITAEQIASQANVPSYRVRGVLYHLVTTTDGDEIGSAEILTGENSEVAENLGSSDVSITVKDFSSGIENSSIAGTVENGIITFKQSGNTASDGGFYSALVRLSGEQAPFGEVTIILAPDEGALNAAKDAITVADTIFQSAVEDMINGLNTFTIPAPYNAKTQATMANGSVVDEPEITPATGGRWAYDSLTGTLTVQSAEDEEPVILNWFVVNAQTHAVVKVTLTLMGVNGEAKYQLGAFSFAFLAAA